VPALVAGAATFFFERDAESAIAKSDGGFYAAADINVNVLGWSGMIAREDPDAAGAVVQLKCGADTGDAERSDDAALDGDIVIAEMFGMSQDFGNWFCAEAEGEYA